MRMLVSTTTTSALPWLDRERRDWRCPARLRRFEKSASAGLLCFFAGLKEQSQARFDQLRHGPLLASRFALELFHNRISNIQRRFHMDTHIDSMAIGQRHAV